MYFHHVLNSCGLRSRSSSYRRSSSSADGAGKASAREWRASGSVTATCTRGTATAAAIDVPGSRSLSSRAEAGALRAAASAGGIALHTRPRPTHPQLTRLPPRRAQRIPSRPRRRATRAGATAERRVCRESQPETPKNRRRRRRAYPCCRRAHKRCLLLTRAVMTVSTATATGVEARRPTQPPSARTRAYARAGTRVRSKPAGVSHRPACRTRRPCRAHAQREPLLLSARARRAQSAPGFAGTEFTARLLPPGTPVVAAAPGACRTRHCRRTATAIRVGAAELTV